MSARRWLMPAIVGLAFALRLYRLGAGSLWYDETVSLMLAGKSLPALIAHTAGDIHPPGYYALLHGWLGLAGRSAFAAAFLSLFFGVLLVALAHRLGARLFGRPAGLLAALLVALSPYNLWYSQEVRMYTLGAALGLGVLASLLAMLRRAPGTPPGWRPLLAYVLCAGLGLWVLYYFAFLLLAVNLLAIAYYLAAVRRPSHSQPRPGRASNREPRTGGADAHQPRSGGASRYRWPLAWLAAQAAALVLYAPWLPIASRQALDPPVPPWRSPTALGDVVLQTWTALTAGQSIEPSAAWPALLLAAVLFALGLLAHTRHPSPVLPPAAAGEPDASPRSAAEWEGAPPPTLPPAAAGGTDASPRSAAEWEGGPLPHPAWLLAGYALLPVALIYLASSVTPLFHVRYAFTYSTPFYILLGAGLVALGRRWRPAAWLSLAILLAFGGVSILAYHRQPEYAADDHQAAVSFLAARWRPGDAVLVDAGYAYPALLAYWDGDPIAWRGRLVGETWPPASQAGPALFQVGTVDGDPGLGWGDPRSDFYAASRAGTLAALERLFAGHDRVWLYRIYDTVTDPEGTIRDWLAEHGTLFEDQVFTGESQLRVQGWATGRDPLAGVEPREARADALADGSLRLLAAGPPAPRAAVGGAMDLALVWRVESPPAPDALLFAGLFDAAGRRWAQVDERPLGTLFPVAAWSPGRVVRTPVRVPLLPGTPPGRYRLEIGWYRFVDGRPVWLPWAGGERLALGEVSVEPPADWAALPRPAPQQTAGVTIGDGRRLLGFDAPLLLARPGDTVSLDLFWEALAEVPPGGVTVLQLADDSGRLWHETALPVAAGWAAGRVERQPCAVQLPGSLPAGAYNLAVGVRRPDGTWLPVRRGPFSLGATYRLLTIGVESRPVNRVPPQMQHPLDARLADVARVIGYDLALDADGAGLELILYWQALRPADGVHKIFAHLIVPGDPSAIRAQADVYPGLPATAWAPGEYLAQPLRLALPGSLPPGEYELLVGFYVEAGGNRLPFLDAAGRVVGDSLRLAPVALGE